MPIETRKKWIVGIALLCAISLIGCGGGDLPPDLPPDEKLKQAVRDSVFGNLISVEVEMRSLRILEDVTRAELQDWFSKRTEQERSRWSNLSGENLINEIASHEAIDDLLYEEAVVDVIFKGRESFSGHRKSIELKMVDIYEAIYTSGVPVRAATVEAHLDLVDAYGNERLGKAYGTRLRNTEAYRINWENKLIVDFTKIWEVYWMQEFLEREPSFWD